MDRREFLGWLSVASGASLLAGCDLTRKSEKIIPYLVPPEDGVIPGEATYVASTCTECPVNCGVTARIRDERPVKVDGRAGHPVNDGALCLRGQASLSRLYHVDRIRQPLVQDGSGKLVPAAWTDAIARATEALRRGGENVLLPGRVSGSLDLLMDDFSARAGVRREPGFELFNHAAVREANRSLFGRAVVPAVRPEQADLVITVGADVIETHGNPVAFSLGLSKRRSSGDHFTWYHLEPHVSMSGFKSDHRLVLRAGSEASLLAFLLHAVSGKRALDARAAAHVAAVPAVSAQKAAETTGLGAAVLEELAGALAAAHSPLLIAGGVSTAQETGLDVARLAALLQYACGMHGHTVDLAGGTDYSRVGSLADLDRLAGRLEAGQVGTLIVFNVDPVGLLPEGSKFAAAMDRAAFRIGVGDMLTPTMQQCDVVLPLSHALESWGDAEPAAGVVNVIQPAIKPLFDTLADGDVLLQLMAAMGHAAPGTTYQQYVLDRWARDFGPAAAQELVKTGWLQSPVAAAPAAPGQPDHRYTFEAATAPTGAVLVVAPSTRWFDGRSSWLPMMHEVPDPLTTVTWDNWVSVGTDTAAALAVSDDDVVELRGEGWTLPLPVRLQPGLARDVYMIQRGAGSPLLGWSRTSGEANAVAVGIAVAKTGNRHRVAKTSGSLYEEGRGAVPGSHPEHFNQDVAPMPDHHGKPREDITFYPLPEYPNYRWAMAIDMEKCVGCSACIAACTIENNVPMVGRENHLRGREMGWIRLEPYYAKDGTSGDFVPAMCQHCDYAPCEPVCPVYATYHNDEGLNAQVYNRCVGTRYCGNNCPYKQRRFNYFSWEKRPHPLDLMTNPDVSMRGKGIMEKCTFCVQRIRHARDVAKDEKRTIREGEVTPACAQACPGKAIVFGNLLDTNSEVYRWSQHARSTRLLEELGTGPGVFYLKKGNGHHGA